MTDEEIRRGVDAWMQGENVIVRKADWEALVAELRAARQVLAQVDPIHAMGEMCPLCRGIDKHAPDCAVVAVLGRPTGTE